MTIQLVRLLLIPLSVCSLCLTSMTSAQTTVADLANAIRLQSLHHPYLFFTDEEKPSILQRIQNDPESRNIMKGLLVEGNRLLKMPFQKKHLLESEHPRFESTNEPLSYRSKVSEGAFTLSFLYQMTGDRRYASRAIEFALALCEVPEWRYAAHGFDIIYPRVWPWNVPDDQVVFSYDLGSARAATILSTAYDWLYPALTVEERDKIRGALLEKAILRVRGNYDFFWWSTAYRCNWSGVCFGGLGLSSLALLKENPQLLDVTVESFNRISLAYDQIGEEGGWQEGRGYFAYLLDASMYFADALKRVSHGKWNLFQHPKIKTHAADFQLFALTAAFGDSYGNPSGPTFPLNKLVSETESRTTAFYRDHFFGAGTEIFDIIWPRSSIRGEEPVQKSRYFRNIGWAILRSSFRDPSTVTVACKAGLNDDPHHGHLDCGQFTITWHDVPFIRDLGRMEYDELYFNEERFNYVLASSEGHNVISVNGEQQIPAKTKHGPWLENIGGTILEYRSDETRDYVLLDATRAYPDKHLKKWRRNIVLEKPAATMILDEVGAEVSAEIRARFFPGVGNTPRGDTRGQRRAREAVRRAEFSSARSDQGSYEVMNNHVFLADGRNHCMVLIPLVLDNDVTIGEDEVVAMVVTEDARRTSHPYVEAITKAKSTTSVIVTIILPVSDRHDAENVTQSARVHSPRPNEIEVSVASTAGSLRWTFERSRDGYVLDKTK